MLKDENKGWTCPRCNTVNSPLMKTCTRCKSSTPVEDSNNKIPEHQELLLE